MQMVEKRMVGLCSLYTLRIIRSAPLCPQILEILETKMRIRDKSLKIIAAVFMPIGIFIVIAGMLARIIRAYFVAGYRFWSPK